MELNRAILCSLMLVHSFQNRERGCDVAGDFSLDGIDLEPLRQIPPARPDVRRGRRSVVEVRTNEPVNVVDTECELVSYQLKTHEKDGVRAVVDTTEMTNAVEDSEKMVSKNDIVLQVAVYNSEKPHKSQEFLVLGSQPLTQLRDKIHCLGDEIPSEFPKVKAGFFFMEDTFYRSSEGEDYSTGIAEFLEHHRNEWKVTPKRWRRSSGRLKEERIPVVIHDAAARAAPSVAYDYLQFKSMTETFEHLHIRLGYPYVYVHLGTCEHLIVFRDIRAVNTSAEPREKSEYPKQIYRLSPAVRKCTVCEIQVAHKIVTGDKYAEESPSFFCDECFQNMHYDNAGGLLYSDFEVYPYYYG